MNAAASERDPFDAVAEDFLSRWRAGEKPSVLEYVERYPALANQIRELFPALVLLERHPPAAKSGSATTETCHGPAVPEELGEYRLLREVGRGGMGVVYEAVQVSLQRHVALKVLPLHRLRGPEHLERFRREARIAAGLHHTNIVPVFGVGEHEGIHYYAMQFIRGQGIDEVLREVIALRKERGDTSTTPPTRTNRAGTIAASLIIGHFADQCQTADFSLADPDPAKKDAALCSSSTLWPSPLALSSGSERGLATPSHWHYSRSVAEVGLQVAEALAYAHRQGVLHRDIKPSNLLLDLAGRVWITDFGLAKAEDSEDLTEPDQLVGTIRYMAPERFGGQVDMGSDLYGLGATLYEMLALRAAFEGPNRAEVMERVLHSEPVPPRKLDGRIPRDLETIVLKAMAKEPAHRYASAERMASDLRSFLGDRPIQARRPSLWEQSVRWCRRNPAVAALSAVLAIVLAASMAGAVLKNAQLSTALSESEVANQQASAANKQASAKLWESLRDRARAMRMSRHVGQRLEALRSIAEAIRLPLPPGHSLDELRTEAVAALALPDIEVEREWPGGLTPGIVNVAFDGNLEKYARLAEDGTVTIRRVADDSPEASWKEAGAGVFAAGKSQLRISRDGQYIACWNARSGRLTVRRLIGQDQELCHVGDKVEAQDAATFNCDATKLAYVMTDGRIALVELPSGKARYLPAAGSMQGNFRFSPDGRRFAIRVSRQGKDWIEIRDLAMGKVEISLPHEAWASPAWHPGGQMLATRGWDLKIRLWDVQSAGIVRILEGHKNQGITADFDSTGRLLLSNDWSGILRLWEVSSGRQLLSFPAAGSNYVSLSPQNRLPALDVEDHRMIQLLRLHGNRAYQTIPEDGLPLAQPGGQLLAISSNLRPPAFLDVATGREVARFPISDCTALHWESSGALLTGSRSGLFRWPLHPAPSSSAVARSPDHATNAGLGESVQYRLGPPERLLSSAAQGRWGFSADGQTIAVPSHNQGALVLHRGPPRRIVRLKPQQDISQCAVSPDGHWVVTGSQENADGLGIRIWEAATGRLVKALPLLGRWKMTFSPDGRWLLTTASGCRLWHVGTWTEGLVVGGPAGCFSPDSCLLAVQDAAGAIRLVSTQTGALVVRLESPEQAPLEPQCFTADGTQLIATGADTGSLHIWDLRELRRGLAELGLDWDEPPSCSQAGRVIPP
jgi:serine/threonine protein kinase/WD40 repeat protein